MEPYYIGEVPESRRRLLRALSIEVVDLPADEVILFPYCSTGGYYLSKSSTH